MAYAYSSRRPRKGRPPSTPAAPAVQAPSGALINAVLAYADIQLDMGGGKIMLRMSPERMTDPVIRQPLGREAARLGEVSVIWDERETVITNAILHHNTDYTPYEGITLDAWPGMTIAGGEVVWDGKQFHPRAGRGRFLQCGAPTLLPRK